MITLITQKKLKNPIPIFIILSLIARLAKFLRIENLINNSILFIVRGYQLYISPHKGFSCAYKKLHNEQSCSSYFYTCVDRYDLNTASTMLQQRFKECNQANQVLNSQANQKKKQNSKKQSKENDSSCCCSGEVNQQKKPNPKKRTSKKKNREGIDPNDVYDCCSLDYFPICGCGDADYVAYDSQSCCGDTSDCGSCDTGGCDTGGCDTGGSDCGGSG